MKSNQFCYAITVGNKTKIGLSKNPKARTSGILTQAGIHQDDAEVSFFEVEDMRACEKACHQHLSDVREAGEWFSVSHKEAVSVIKTFSCENLRREQAVMSLREMESFFSIGCKPLYEKMINDTISSLVTEGLDKAIAEVVVAAAACDRTLYELPAFLRGAGEPEVNCLSEFFLWMESKNQDLLQSNVEFRDRVIYLIERGEQMATDMRNKTKLLSSR